MHYYTQAKTLPNRGIDQVGAASGPVSRQSRPKDQGLERRVPSSAVRAGGRIRPDTRGSARGYQSTNSPRTGVQFDESSPGV